MADDPEYDAQPVDTPVISIRGLRIYPERYQIEVDGCRLSMTHVEMATLVLLARRPERVFTYQEILDEYHDGYHEVSERAVKVVIYRIRQKLGPYRGLIQPMRGVGYVIRLNERLHSFAWPVTIMVSLAHYACGSRRAAAAICVASVSLLALGGAVAVNTPSFAGWRSSVPTTFLGSIPAMAGPGQLQAARVAGESHLASLRNGAGSGLDWSGEKTYWSVAYPHLEDFNEPLRLHEWHVSYDAGANPQLQAFPRRSIVVTGLKGPYRPLATYAPQLFPPQSRVRPTGSLRVLPNHHFLVLDFDGRGISELDAQGRQVRSLLLPSESALPLPDQSTLPPHLRPRPFENIALTPGGWVIAAGRLAMNEPATTGQVSFPAVSLNLNSPERVIQHRIPATAPGGTLCDVLALDDRYILILERSVAGATGAPSHLLSVLERHPDGRFARQAKLIIDLSSLVSSEIAIEGLAWGDPLDDGRSVLLAIDDQSRNPGRPSSILAFAIALDDIAKPH